MSIEIPLRSSNEEEVIEIQLDNLPDVDELLSVLENERSALHIWHSLAIHYYRQGRPDDMLAILKKATDPARERDYEGTNQERIAALNALAAYYCQRSMAEKDKRVVSDWLQNAVANFNMADSIDMKEVPTWLGKGVLHLLKGDFERASYHFKYAMDQKAQVNEIAIPAILGKANLAYAQGRWKEALNLYKKALSESPSSPAEVRAGIGLCLFKLGHTRQARAALERALVLNEKCIPALLCLAVLEHNSSAPDGLIKALRLFKKVYQYDPTQATAANFLANHLFYKGEIDKAHSLALSAFHNTANDTIKAESCYVIGRSYQKQEMYDQAFQFYFQASKFNPSLLRAQYGLGQMYLYKQQTSKAIGCFEKVRANDKDSYEAVRILASLYASQGKTDKARELFKQAVTLREMDVEAWIEYGSVLETVDVQAAKTAYVTAKDLLLNKAKVPVPCELWSNIGVLCQSLGQLDEAKEAYDQALAAMQADTDEVMQQYYKGLSVTLRFNIARWHEAMGDLAKARAEHQDILREHPDYMDSHVRLGMMLQASGYHMEAANRYKEALSYNTNHVGVRNLLGALHLSQHEIVPAQKAFEGVLKLDRKDAYASLALGNIWNISATPDKLAKADVYRERALQAYSKVLSRDSKNIYAANGIGVVLAEQGHVKEAREVFLQVREATGDLPDVWVNLAHVYCAEGLGVNAMQLYNNCLKRFHHGHNATILLYLARAAFMLGKYFDSVTSLQKACHISPHDQDLHYNLALAQQMLCVSLLRAQAATSTDLNTAIKAIGQAIRIFEYLKKEKSSRAKFSERQVDRDCKYSKDLLKQANHMREKALYTESRQNQRLAQLENDRKTHYDRLMQAREEDKRQQEAQQLALQQRREREIELQELAKQQLREEQLQAKQKKSRAQEQRDRDSKEKSSKGNDDDFIDYGSDAEQAGDISSDDNGEEQQNDDEVGEAHSDASNHSESRKRLRMQTDQGWDNDSDDSTDQSNFKRVNVSQ